MLSARRSGTGLWGGCGELADRRLLRRPLADTRRVVRVQRGRQGPARPALGTTAPDMSTRADRMAALIAWIEGACVDELPHAQILAAINRWRDKEEGRVTDA